MTRELHRADHAGRRLHVGLIIGIALLVAFAARPGMARAQDADTGAVSVGAFADGHPLAGVCFRLTGGGTDAVACGADVDPFNAVFEAVPFGDYILAVDSVPEGCTSDELPTSVTVDQAVVGVGFDFDCPSGATAGTVSATITDATSGAFFPGVCLELVGDGYDQSGCTIDGAFNDVIFADVPFDAYTLSVQSAPDGCTTDRLPDEFVLDADNNLHGIGVAFTCAPGGGAGQSITLHVASCPADTADLFAECHGRGLAGIAFFIGASSEGTDASGVATSGVPTGTVTVSQNGVTVTRYQGVYVYCTDQGDGAVLFDGRADTGVFAVEVAPRATIVCDIYNLTAPTGGGTTGGTGAGSGEGTPGSGGTTPIESLPRTGSGVRDPAAPDWAVALAALAALVAGFGAGIAALHRRQVAGHQSSQGLNG